MTSPPPPSSPAHAGGRPSGGLKLPVDGLISRIIAFTLTRRAVTLIILALVILYGLYVMPFERKDTILDRFPSDPVPVDAIPDIGEKQQIVFTRWPGRSPQDVEDQITFPLVARLLGVPGVKTVRATSMFGFSSIYVIFDDDADFYESRTRILEKLGGVSSDLPPDVTPELGPDATALGQVFWYTVEGEGFDLDELRAIQDFNLRYALLSVEGVAEVASVGGFAREIQVDVDPEAMRVHDVTLAEVERAVAGSNLDIGARELVNNGVEYFVRGVGFIESPTDVEKAVIRAASGTPLTVRQVATVTMGPAPRRGALDKGGAEVVGGVVTARYGENPQAVVARIKEKIEAISAGLPRKTLEDGRVSSVRIVPFYDRSEIIAETIGTLGDALTQQILITILVILLLLFEFKSALLVAATLPVGVLLSLGLMKQAGVDSNIMSLGGIIIAIGTMVDVGIIVTESMVTELGGRAGERDPRPALFRAANDVGSAVLTAVATTVVSFLPVFAMGGPEAKLFVPLAFTKTFALVASIVVGLTLLPTLASFVLGAPGAVAPRAVARVRTLMLLVLAVSLLSFSVEAALVAFALFIRALVHALANEGRVALSPSALARVDHGVVAGLVVIAVVALARVWMPLGPGHSVVAQVIAVGATVAVWTSLLFVFHRQYPRMLAWVLAHRRTFAIAPLSLVAVGVTVWLGFAQVCAIVPASLDVIGAGDALRDSRPWRRLSHLFPGLEKEFMPPLDEGTFLYMPTVMPHASIGETLDVMRKQDMAFAGIPEVKLAVGKLGRAETPLDPAPLSMIETIIHVHPEYGPPDPDTGRRPRLWRDHIRSMDDVWQEIVHAGEIPGATSAPKLMPIATRIVMLQSGMRAPMGVKVKGESLGDIEALSLAIERELRSVDDIRPETVLADRVVGKPYLEIRIDRDRAARYGVRIVDAQAVVQTALGGRTVTTTVNGRERYPVRVRYQREERDSMDAMMRALVPAVGRTGGGMGGESLPGEARARAQVPLSQIADVAYVPGPLSIKSEDGFLVAYVTFDKQADAGEVDVVERARAHLDAAIAAGTLVVPRGASFAFAGTYENQVRSERTLMVVLPVALALILVLLLLEFNRFSTAAAVFSGIAVAWAGGFVFLHLWNALVAADPSLFGLAFSDVFRAESVRLSVAVWVGFIALFGIASDDGVVMASVLDQRFAERTPTTVEEVRATVLEGGMRRIRPCLMTTATTVLALLPVLTSHGRGADVMAPMALPSFGGMLFELLTLFVVPAAYAAIAERRLASGEEA